MAAPENADTEKDLTPAEDERPDPADATRAGETAPLDAETPDAEPTERRAAVLDETARRSAGEQESPRFRDVTGTLGDYVRGRVAAVAAFARGHRLVTGLLAVLAVAAVALLVVASVRAGSLPDDETIAADARERLEAPAYSAGSFGTSNVLVARDVEVRSRERSATAPDDESAQFGASGYATADVLVTYSSSSVTAEVTATLGYALVDGAWVGVGDPQDVRVAWRTSSGVDQQRVIENVDVLLGRAETLVAEGDAATDALTLSEIYEGAAVEVESEAFDADAQTDTLEVVCTQAGAYEAYVCRMSVTFSFRAASGSWDISALEVSEGAKQRTFEPLVGTWKGTFQSQETDDTKCLAARESGLSLVIEGDATDQGVTRLTGTVSGLAHYHQHPSQDSESCEGDAAFKDVAFSATLVGGRDEDTGSDLTFVATLPEDVGGTVTITLSFGTEEDPSRVTAQVKTTYPYTGSFLFIPYDETITYTDTFVLTHVS